VICITKLDLAGGEAELQGAVKQYRQAGYPVILTSALTGEALPS